MGMGRRERVKARVQKNGMMWMSNVEVVEALLYPFILRIDTMPIAQKMLEHFGDVKGVMRAKPNELFFLGGITRQASRLHYFTQTLEKMLTQARKRWALLRDERETTDFMLRLEEPPGTYALLLDGDQRLLRLVPLHPRPNGQGVAAWPDLLPVGESVLLVSVGRTAPTPDDHAFFRAFTDWLKGQGPAFLDWCFVDNGCGCSLKKMGALKRGADWEQLCADIGHSKRRCAFYCSNRGHATFVCYKDMCAWQANTRQERKDALLARIRTVQAPKDLDEDFFFWMAMKMRVEANRQHPPGKK